MRLFSPLRLLSEYQQSEDIEPTLRVIHLQTTELESDARDFLAALFSFASVE